MTWKDALRPLPHATSTLGKPSPSPREHDVTLAFCVTGFDPSARPFNQ
jgi:hypothetical protein